MPVLAKPELQVVRFPPRVTSAFRPNMRIPSIRVRARRLAARVDEFVGFLLLAYAQAMFLRPMRRNLELIGRHAPPKQAAFEQLRATLYWNLVLEVMKLCGDDDRRTASIPVMMRQLKEPELRTYLLRLYSRPALPRTKGESHRQWRSLCKGERANLRKKFRDTYARLRANVIALKRSTAFLGLKKVRNQKLAHHQVVTSQGGIRRIDLGKLNLKIGDETKILEQTRQIADDLSSLARRASFSWEGYLAQEERDVCAFWQIESLDGPVSAQLPAS